ncbi:MAG: hypothetical protein HDP34_04535 [Clostridia bacterium]|nr:hypothetical protein [Clostridia bacterium]
MKSKLCRLSIVSTAEAALRKLKKDNIAVYDCIKDGAFFVFSVKDKDVKKVFAIFSKPCYNIKVIKKSRETRTLNTLLLRAGLIVGAAAFIAVALISNAFMLKIEVSGSGSYLQSEVLRIAEDEGAGRFKPFSAFNRSVATGKILALPEVTFCNIEKRGSVLIIDVQVDDEHFDSASKKPLVSDADGVVRNIVAVCGTAAVNVGDSVKKGDTLIYAYTLAGENTIECLAAGYAEIECRKQSEYFAAEESEQNLKNALSSLLLESENITSQSYKVVPADGGIKYVIDFTYLHKLSINLT